VRSGRHRTNRQSDGNVATNRHLYSGVRLRKSFAAVQSVNFSLVGVFMCAKLRVDDSCTRVGLGLCFEIDHRSGALHRQLPNAEANGLHASDCEREYKPVSCDNAERGGYRGARVLP
jgi:hypothetical protein